MEKPVGDDTSRDLRLGVSPLSSIYNIVGLITQRGEPDPGSPLFISKLWKAGLLNTK